MTRQKEGTQAASDFSSPSQSLAQSRCRLDAAQPGISSCRDSFGRQWAQSYSNWYIPEEHDSGRKNVDASFANACAVNSSVSCFVGSKKPSSSEGSTGHRIEDSKGIFAGSFGSCNASVGGSVDATVQSVLRTDSNEEIDLRLVFGREYIRELSVNLDPACNGKVTVNCRDMHGNTALHLAAWRGDRLACHWLLSNGADVKTLNNDGRRWFSLSVRCAFPVFASCTPS